MSDQARERALARRDAEVRLVGNLLYRPDEAATAGRIAKPEDFANEALRAAYERVLVESGKLDDPEHLVDPAAIFARDQIELGRECFLIAGTGAQVGYYARQVAMWSTIDRVGAAGEDLASAMRESFPGARDAVCTKLREHVATVHEAVTRAVADETGRTMAEEIDSLLESLSTTPSGISLGMPDLDFALSPVQPGNLLVVASRPGIGKTTFALNVAHHLIVHHIPVLFLSLEMSAREMTARFLSRMSGVNSLSLRRHRFEPGERERVERSAYDLRAMPLVVKELRDCTLSGIAVETNSMRPALVVVDYLQLVSHPSAESRVAEVGAVSRGLKQLAREANCVVLAVSQLSRQADNDKPHLRDLRWAGEIEQDADAVVLLWKDKEELRFEVAKNRHGQTCAEKLYYDLSTYKIGGIGPVAI